MPLTALAVRQARPKSKAYKLFDGRGYERSSLVGYGSLWLYNEFGDWFQGMLLVAPYLGPRDIIESEFGSDGLLLLAFGEDDKFAKGGGIVSVLLPEKQAFRRDGSHNWDIWLEFWRDVLESPAWAELLTTAD